LRDLGLWALGALTEYGGASVNTLCMALVKEEVNKSMLSRNLIGGNVNPQLHLPSDYLKEKHLYPTDCGEVRSAAPSASQTRPAIWAASRQPASLGYNH